jgi:hypothetical protein
MWVTSRMLLGLLVVIAVAPPIASAQGRIATAKGLRCRFSLSAAGRWETDGTARSTVAPARLTLLFEAIDADDGTARLRTGAVTSDVAARQSGGYLHLMQVFKTGAMYTTTVFDQEATRGGFRAVHSRHESFTVPLPGATSTPEQYYGECRIVE